MFKTMMRYDAVCIYVSIYIYIMSNAYSSHRFLYHIKSHHEIHDELIYIYIYSIISSIIIINIVVGGRQVQAGPRADPSSEARPFRQGTIYPWQDLVRDHIGPQIRDQGQVVI